MPSHEKRLGLLQVCKAVSELSKDPSTKVGCILVGPSGEIRSMGYNGMPRGCNDTNSVRNQRPEKYFWYEHAERNALYNAARVGTPIDGSTAYVTMIPCMDCARGLIQSGVTCIISFLPIIDQTQEVWKNQYSRFSELITELGVEVLLYDGQNLQHEPIDFLSYWTNMLREDDSI